MLTKKQAEGKKNKISSYLPQSSPAPYGVHCVILSTAKDLFMRDSSGFALRMTV